MRKINFQIKEVADVRFVDLDSGKVLTEIQATDISTGLDIYKEEQSIFEKSFIGGITLELKNAFFNQDILNQLIQVESDPSFNVIIYNSKIKQLSFILNRTKNKRMKKKLQKRVDKLDHWIYNRKIPVRLSQIKGL